jgi:HD-GYP domain-containing protein (c-di-GMP phosphodiesterase class II)
LGYPRQLRDIKINPLARIVGLANYFVDLLYDSSTNQMQRSPDDALRYIEETLGQPFNKQAFVALKQVIHVTYLKSRLP